MGCPTGETQTCYVAWADWILGLGQYLEAAGYSGRTVNRHVSWLKSMTLYFTERNLGPESLEAPATLDEYLADFATEFHLLRGRLPGQAYLGQCRSAAHRLVEFARQSGRLELVPPSRRLPENIHGFLKFCREHRGLSQGTLSVYERLLSKLVAFVEQHGRSELAGVPLDLLDQFVAQFGRDKSRTTASSGLSGLRSFLRYLFLIGLEPEDRSGWLEGPRLYREMRLPRHLTDEQLEEVLAGVDRSTPGGKQEWAVLLLLSCLGLRIGEVVGLRLEDLDFEAGSLHVRRSKTRTAMVIPLAPELKEALEAYLRVRPETHHQDLFVTWRAPIRPYASGSSLDHCVRKHLRRINGAPSFGPHTLRHTLAHRLRRGGTPLAVIRRVLGHAHSNSTGRYLRIALEELAEVADNYGELL